MNISPLSGPALPWRTRTARWLETLERDVVLSARTLARAPAVPLAIVATLSLGLGVNASVFSFLDQVFLRTPPGVSDVSLLRRVWIQHPAGATGGLYSANKLSYHHVQSIAEGVRGLATLALYTTQPNTQITIGDNAITGTVSYASAAYFEVLAVRPLVGRWFTDAEADVHAAARLAVVSHAFWKNHLGGDPAALGRTLTIANRAYVIVGIAAPRFSGIDLEATDLWLPLGTMPTHEVPRVSFWNSSLIFFSVFARMAPGVDERVVEARATAAYRNAPITDFPPSAEGHIYLRSIIDARGLGDRPRELSIAVRLGAVALIILLIAAANVVNLLVARAIHRRREAGVRLALGIPRARLMRLFFIEAMLLSGVATGAAILTAHVAGTSLRELLAPGTHFSGGVVGWRLVVFTGLLALLTSVAVALAPARQARRLDVVDLLKLGRRDAPGHSWLSHVFVSAQTALCVVLIVGAALFVSSLRNVQKLHTGFDVSRLAYATVVPPSGVTLDTVALAAGMRAAAERVRLVPGVEAVAFARDEPMTWFGRAKFYTENDSSEAPGRPLPTISYVSASFFRTVGTRVTRGTVFEDDSPASVNAIVVNQAVAQTFWPNQDPIGRCVRVQRRDAPCSTVVAVVENAVRQRLVEGPTPQLYLPLFESIRGSRPPRVMVIRADPAHLPVAMSGASRALGDVFPAARADVVRMSDRLAPQYRPWILGATLFSGLGLLALLVASMGIYSSVSYMVTQRMHEIGVRIALGAAISRIFRDVIGRGLRPVVVGCAVGTVAAVGASRVVASLLYDIKPQNPYALVVGILSLLLVGVAAACVPAFRATRIDPVRVLEGE